MRTKAAMAKARTISNATIHQKLGRSSCPIMRPWTPLTIQAATEAIPRGTAATMRRRRTPQVTTDGPESHNIRSRGGRLRKARTRSPHALLNCCLASGIESDDRLAGTRATPDWIQYYSRLFYSMRGCFNDGYLSLGRIRRLPERVLRQAQRSWALPNTRATVSSYRGCRGNLVEI